MKKKISGLSIICLLLMFVSGVYALGANPTSTTNNYISTAAVNISLTNYTNDNGKEVILTKTFENVMPGDTLSIIPKVNNLGIDCYIRARVYITSGGNKYNDVDFNNDKFIKKGDYYYYKDVMKTGNTINLFDSIMIPYDLDNYLQNKTGVITVVVEAIQERNFTNDLTKDNPWNGIEVKEVIDRSYSYNDKSPSKIDIKYYNGANEYIKITDDFFNDFLNMVPGDTIESKFSIFNNSDVRKRFFMSIDSSKLSDKQLNVLKQVKLKVTSKSGKINYNGNLFNANGAYFGEYNPGVEDELTFSVTIPKEADNEVSIQDFDYTWIFSVEDIKNENIVENLLNPNTLDNGITLSVCIFTISSLCVVILMIVERKRRIKEELEKSKKKRKKKRKK